MTDKIKVLMVDDEERFRETTSKLLKKKGFLTTLAESGEKAIEIIKTHSQDVVILDIKMEGMDGHKALKEIKKIDPYTQVIMLTGHGTPDSAIKALVGDAFDYLNKPCDIDILASKINDAFIFKTKGPRKAEKQAREIMIRIEDYTTVNINNTVKEAMLKLMTSFRGFVSSDKIMETGHRSLLVYDDNTREPVGILCIIDLIEAVRPAYLSAPKPSTADSVQFSSMFWEGLFTTQIRILADRKVGSLMSETPPTIDSKANLMMVSDVMFETGQRRLLVKENEKVVGLIREQDLFFEMANIML